MRSIDRAEATANLKVIVNDMDPLYVPARFLLGYACLVEGDASNAVRAFRALMEEFDAPLPHILNKLQAALLHQQPRMVWLCKRVPALRRWLACWREQILHAVIGGRFYRAGVAWWHIKQAENDQSELGASLRKMLIDSQLSAFDDLPGERKKVEIAIQTASSSEREKARGFLDHVLDLDQIRRLDAVIAHIDATVGLCPLLRESDRGSHVDEALRRLADQRKTCVGIRLEALLDPLKLALEEGKWKDCQDIIRACREFIAVPSVYHLIALLDDPSVDSLSARIAEFFIPALRVVRLERALRREPLYLETVYHHAMALFLTFDTQEIDRALCMIDEVRRTRLPRRQGAPHKIDDLEVLMDCVARQAAWYQYSETHKWPVLLSDGLGEDLAKTLTIVAASPKRRPEIRAAAYVTLGMLKRHDLEALEDRELMHPSPDPPVNSDTLLHEETEMYRRAIELCPTGLAHCHLAECLIRAGRKDEARLHTVQAMNMAPTLRLAIDLQGQLKPTTETKRDGVRDCKTIK